MLEQIRKYVEVTKEDLSKQVILKKKGDIYFLLLNRPKANTFNHDFIRAIQVALDQVESSEGAACLVSCSLNDKIFSAGLDLKYVTTFKHKEEFRYFVLEFIAMFGRLALMNVPTIAVVKGAAIAGGCMFSFAHDIIYAVDKATFACNEVDIGLPLPPGMNGIIKRKHSNPISFRDMTLFGKKFTEKQAAENKMIDGIVKDLSAVIEKAETIASYGTNRANFKNLKSENNKQLIDACFNKQHAVGSVGQFTIAGLPKL